MIPERWGWPWQALKAHWWPEGSDRSGCGRYSRFLAVLAGPGLMDDQCCAACLRRAMQG